MNNRTFFFFLKIILLINLFIYFTLQYCIGIRTLFFKVWSLSSPRSRCQQIWYLVYRIHLPVQETWGDAGSIPGSEEDALEKERAATPVVLPGNPMDRGVWRVIHGVAESDRTQPLSTHMRPAFMLNRLSSFWGVLTQQKGCGSSLGPRFYSH